MIDTKIFLANELKEATDKHENLKDICVKTKWDISKDVNAYYDNRHRIRVLGELIKTVNSLPMPQPFITIPERFLNEKGFENFSKEYMNNPVITENLMSDELKNKPITVTLQGSPDPFEDIPIPKFCGTCFEPADWTTTTEEKIWHKGHKVNCHTISSKISMEERIELNRRMRDNPHVFKRYIDKLRNRAW